MEDVIADAERRISQTDPTFPVIIDRATMSGVESILRDELKAHADNEGRLRPEDTGGVDLLSLFGKFWNGSQAQSANGRPREVLLSESEIGYISGLSSGLRATLTKEQTRALGGFKSASDKVMGKDRKKEGKKAGGRRSTSAWFDTRW